MAFTNIFDNTAPLDTQAANLLGQDIRTFKVDIQQRVAAMSGLEAAKPAFGSDTQAATWSGALYFATDTGKIWQWNGSAWVDITSSFTLGAPLDSPAFTGTPTAPTAAVDTSTTQLATTSFVLNPLTWSAASGYQKLPTGLMFQWKNVTLSGTYTGGGVYSASFTWPEAFPNGVLIAVAGVTQTASGYVGILALTAQSASGFTLAGAAATGTTVNISVNVLAIGW